MSMIAPALLTVLLAIQSPMSSQGAQPLPPDSTAARSAGSLERTWPLVDLTREGAHRAWRPIHDVVMGGKSEGTAEPTVDGVRFRGVMRTEGGGFVSFRVSLNDPLESLDGVRLRVRGDGQTWKLTLRRQDSRIVWQAPFQTMDARASESQAEAGWSEVTLRFEDFCPSYRGQLVLGQPPLGPGDFAEIGVILGDAQAGAYGLEIASFAGWARGEGEPALGSHGARAVRTDALAHALNGMPTAETLLENVTWNERLLVVSEPLERGTLGAPASIQRGRFTAGALALALRDMRVVHLCGGAEAHTAGVALSKDVVRTLRELWGISPGAWSCVLVGKDGGVKARWNEPVELREITDHVDPMPIR